MYFSLAQLARLLDMPESAVEDALEKHQLRSEIIEGQPRIHRLDIIEWATRRNIPLPLSLHGEGGLSLKAALEAGGILYNVQAGDKAAVIARIAQTCAPVIDTDEKMLEEVLIARENLCPTTVGDGIAFPHPRAPIIFRLPCPVINLMFLQKAVDFGALDRQPVHTLFTLLAATPHDHLRMLALLSFALQKSEFAAAVRKKLPARDILAAAEAADRLHNPS